MTDRPSTPSGATLRDVFPRKQIRAVLVALFFSHVAAATVPSCVADEWLERRYTERDLKESLFIFEMTTIRAESANLRLKFALRDVADRQQRCERQTPLFTTENLFTGRTVSVYSSDDLTRDDNAVVGQ